MARTLNRVVLAIIVTMGATAQAQFPGPRAPDATTASNDQPPSSEPPAGDAIKPDSAGLTLQSSLIDRLLSPLSQEDDPDGQINTDRPTFTPANTVVPRGRVQFESGFTFDYQQTATTRSPAYDFPELAMRVGIAKRVEFRTFWFGQTYSQILSRSGGPPTQLNGPSDMEIGFKWQLIEGNKDKLWIPTTALITSVYAPTGGTSPFSSENVDPYINLIYGWTPNEKLTIAGSTGYLERREHFAPRPSRRSDSFERYHQSLVAFYSVGDRTTLFYEWYILMPTGAPENRVLSYMDGGVIYHPTPNTQIDVRVGFGLNGNPQEIFTGTGFSVRF
jgi:Putative MetA-pathway of phenol degradation